MNVHYLKTPKTAPAAQNTCVFETPGVDVFATVFCCLSCWVLFKFFWYLFLHV